MADTVIDSLVVQLKLDPEQFKKGQRDADDAMRKTRDSAVAHGKNIEKSNKVVKESFEEITKSALTLFAAFTSFTGMKDLITDTTNANAQLGRLAANLNMPVGALSAFDNAVYKFGGSAEGAQQSLQSLFNIVTKLRTEGKNAPDWFFRIGGANLDVSHGPQAVADQIQRNISAYNADRGTKAYILSQLGLDQGTANFMLQSPDAYKGAITAQNPYAVTAEQAKAAQDLQGAFRQLAIDVGAFDNAITYALSGPLGWLLTGGKSTAEADKTTQAKLHDRSAAYPEKPEWGAHADWGKLWKEAQDWWNAPSKAVPGPTKPNAADLPLESGAPMELSLSPDDIDKIAGPGAKAWTQGRTVGAALPINVGGTEVGPGNPLPVTIMQGATQSGGFWDWLTGGSSGPGASGGGTIGSIFSAVRGILGGHGGGVSDSYGSGGRVPSGEGARRASHLVEMMQREYGLTRDQAIGAAGVMGYESGDFRTMQEGGQAPGHGGWGYAQWTGPRRRAFMAWAAANKLDPSSPEANEGFLKYEIATNPTYRRAIERLKQTRGVDDAAYSWETNYEGMTPSGPGIPAFGAHIARARAYARGLPTSGAAASSSGIVNHLRTSSNSTSNQVHIASLAVHTQATDAAGIVRDIRPTLTSDLFASRANYGLA